MFKHTTTVLNTDRISNQTQGNFDINRNGVSDWDEYEITMLVNGDENTKYESFVMEDLDQIALTFTSK